MYHLQRFLHLVGEPGSGKSTAQKLMQALIGETNSTSTDLETLDNNRFEVSRFIGKKLCVMPDQSDYRGSIATFLRLTGNDSVRAERKNRDANNFLFEGLVCISSNGPVFLSRTGKELTRRQILLEFTQPVENSDPQFLKRLLSALPAYTNYLLNIPEADVVATLLRQSNTVTRSQWEAKKRVDSIAAWVDDCLLLNPDHQIKVGSDKNDASSLFGSYQIHCRNSGGEPKGLRDFSEMVLNLLKLIFPGRSFDKKRTRQGYVLTGVALRDEIDLDPFLTDVLFPHFGSSVQDGVGSVQDGCRVCVDPQPLLHKESVECVGLSDISLENSEKEEGNTEGEEGSDHDLKTDHSIQQNKDPNILHTLHKPSDTKGLNPAHHPTPTLHTTLHTLHTTQITIGSTVFYVGDQYPDLIDVPLVVRSIDRPYCVATMPDGSYTTNLFLTEVVLASASA
jgi:putative DNA primase/helicase